MEVHGAGQDRINYTHLRDNNHTKQPEKKIIIDIGKKYHIVSSSMVSVLGWF